MIKSFCALFLSVSSVAWTMDAMNRENDHPNLPHQREHTLEKKQGLVAAPQTREVSVVDRRTPAEIEKRIDFLEGELIEYQSFNQDHCRAIKHLADLNFFKEGFPAGNEEVLKILESVFTNNYGKGGSWGYIVRELYRRPQRFMKEFNQLVDDVLNKNEEKNEEARKLLEKIYPEIGPVSLMIVYYLNNKS